MLEHKSGSLEAEEEALSALQNIDAEAKALRFSSGVMGVVFFAGAVLAKTYDQQQLANLAVVATTYTAGCALLGEIQHTFAEKHIFSSRRTLKQLPTDSR